jgi:ribose/xylose/arabinose/galactoside ABC-type transport system permease subunit
MRLDRIILSLATLLLIAGYVAWALGGAESVRHVSIWLWFAGFGVLSLPLLVWLAHRVVRRDRE